MVKLTQAYLWGYYFIKDLINTCQKVLKIYIRALYFIQTFLQQKNQLSWKWALLTFTKWGPNYPDDSSWGVESIRTRTKEGPWYICAYGVFTTDTRSLGAFINICKGEKRLQGYAFHHMCVFRLILKYSSKHYNVCDTNSKEERMHLCRG